MNQKKEKQKPNKNKPKAEISKSNTNSLFNNRRQIKNPELSDIINKQILNSNTNYSDKNKIQNSTKNKNNKRIINNNYKKSINTSSLKNYILTEDKKERLSTKNIASSFLNKRFNTDLRSSLSNSNSAKNKNTTKY